jgi:hypothetical protein
MSLEGNIRDTLQLQDIELANAMNDLRSNGEKLNKFISDRKSELYNTVSAEHSDSFQKVYGDFQRANDTTKNILYYHVRNKDLDKIQSDIVNQAAAEADNARYDNENSRRQFEINEWTVGNKMDTLFFLQLLFIYLTLVGPMIYGMNAGFIPSPVFYGVTGIFSIAVGLTLLVRYQYTSKTRDNRYWNRRRFAQMGGPPVLPTCPAVTGWAANMLEETLEQADDLIQEGSDSLFDGLENLGSGINSAKNTFNRPEGTPI